MAWLIKYEHRGTLAAAEAKRGEEGEDASPQINTQLNTVNGEQSNHDEPPGDSFDQSTDEEDNYADEGEPPEDSSDDDFYGEDGNDNASPNNEEPQPNGEVTVQAEVVVTNVQINAEQPQVQGHPETDGPSHDVQCVPIFPFPA